MPKNVREVILKITTKLNKALPIGSLAKAAKKAQLFKKGMQGLGDSATIAGGKFSRFGEILNKIAKNPILAVIAGLVLVLNTLKSAIASNEEASFAFKEATAGLVGVFKAMMKFIGENLIPVIELYGKAMVKVGNVYKKVLGFFNKDLEEQIDKWGEAAKESKNAYQVQIEAEKKLIQEGRTKREQIAKTNNDLQEQRAIMNDSNLSVEERLVAEQKVRDLLDEKLKQESELLDLEEAAVKAKIKAEGADTESLNRLSEIKIARENLEAGTSRALYTQNAVRKRLHQEQIQDMREIQALAKEIEEMKVTPFDDEAFEDILDAEMQEDLDKAMENFANAKKMIRDVGTELIEDEGQYRRAMLDNWLEDEKAAAMQEIEDKTQQKKAIELLEKQHAMEMVKITQDEEDEKNRIRQMSIGYISNIFGTLAGLAEDNYALNAVLAASEAAINTFLAVTAILSDRTFPTVAKPYAIAAALVSGAAAIAGIVKEANSKGANVSGSDVSAATAPEYVNVSPNLDVEGTQNVRAYILEDDLQATNSNVKTKELASTV